MKKLVIIPLILMLCLQAFSLVPPKAEAQPLESMEVQEPLVKETSGIFIRPSPQQIFYGTDVSNVTLVKERLSLFLLNLSRTHFNTLYVEFKNVGATGTPASRDIISGTLFYDSQYRMMIDGFVANLLEQGFDLMEYLIEQAHNLGMEVHAWIPILKDEAFIQRSQDIGYTGEVRQRGTILFWTLFSEEGLDPNSGAVRNYIKSLITEIVHKYPLDGINLDYLQYSDEWPFPFTDIRPSTILSLVEEFRNMLDSNLTLSAQVFSSGWEAFLYGQYVEAISRHVDVLMPMTYLDPLSSIEVVVTNLEKLSDAEYMVPCIRSWDTTPEEVKNGITSCRTSGSDGFALFHYSSNLDDDIINLDDLQPLLSAQNLSRSTSGEL